MQAMAACPEFRAELARLFEGEAVQDPLSANLRDKIERLAPMPRVTRQNEEAVNRAYAHEMKIRRKIAAALGEPVKYTNEMNQFINSQMFKTSEERPSPVRIGEALKKVYNGSRYLSGVVQGDAGEIMTQSLGRLEKENEGWDSPFKGQWALEKTCTNPKCKAVTESSESFSRLSAMPMFLPRPSGRQSASIVDVIELECSLDNLPRDCDVCESPNQPAKRTSKVISVLPQYLMVELSRAATGIKDGKPVKTPASMNVKWKNGTRRFHSIAKVTHQGGIEGGHYVAYARYGDDWYKYNDAKRTCVKATTALGAQASVLIYEAEDEDIVAEKGEETKKDEKAEAEAETEQ